MRFSDDQTIAVNNPELNPPFPLHSACAKRSAYVIVGGVHLNWSLLLWVLPPLIFGLFALALGQDANWDLRNYHYYNAYAFLHGRFDYDVVPAATPTFYNPLLHVPFYYLVNLLPPRGVGFVLGALQGLNFPLLYVLARRLIGASTPRFTAGIAFTTAMLGMLGAGNVSEIGTTFADNVISLLMLSALWILVARHRALGGPLATAAGTALAVGVFAGLAVGLKQPAAVYATGLGLGFLGLALPWKRRAALFMAFGAGGLIGLACTGGFWLYELWSRFGNPLFPYFNNVFHSSMAGAADYRDTRFLPADWIEWLFFPLVFTLDPTQTAEAWFRDLRVPLLYCLLLALLMKRLLSLMTAARDTKGSEDSEATSHAGVLRYLLIACVVSYFAWLKLFAIYRYLLVIELLAPLGIWLVITRLQPDRRKAALLATACAVVMTTIYIPMHWGRAPWGDDYFGVTPPALTDPAHTMVLMAGYEPTAYLIPSFPEQVRFVRIQGYFTGPSQTPNGYDRLMQGLIAEHQGQFYVLFLRSEAAMADSALKAYGLQRHAEACLTIHPHIVPGIDDPLYFCQVTKPGLHQSITAAPFSSAHKWE